MGPSDPEEGFKVTDRRRRDDSAPITGATKEPRNASSRSEAREPNSLIESDPSVVVGPPDRNLIGLFMMLGSSALVALGEAPEPGVGQVRPNLQEASALVDLLLLLREKTEGNRSPEESAILGDLIYDLQLRYINVKQRAKPPG